MRAIGIALVVAAIIIAVLVRPVCQPLDEEEVRMMNPPIDRRIDRTLWFKSFQVKDGQWCQCKPWIAHALFF
jgi:hypothetical protein